ncbi:MAG: hypothetical protein ABEI97_00025 [Candidatus Nanohaloarchaea archaeon]
MSTPAPTDIIKNVQDQGYTPRNRRDLRKSQAFAQVATDVGYSFVYDDGDVEVTVREYVAEKRLEVETGTPPARLVPHDDMATEQHTVRLEDDQEAERLTQLYFEADPAVLEQVEAVFEEDPAYEGDELGSGRYQGPDATVTVNASRGKMVVFAQDDAAGEPVELPDDVLDGLELEEMTVLERDGPGETRRRFHATADDFVDLDDIR